ncbi:hypothetical protein HanPI659440_Chr15g0607191 [Helianthus annuus]|nr:hypothetical protein HanPI659440_Chr15g0607191 [Helianthus annuus]
MLILVTSVFLNLNASLTYAGFIRKTVSILDLIFHFIHFVHIYKNQESRLNLFTHMFYSLIT